MHVPVTAWPRNGARGIVLWSPSIGHQRLSDLIPELGNQRTSPQTFLRTFLLDSGEIIGPYFDGTRASAFIWSEDAGFEILSSGHSDDFYIEYVSPEGLVVAQGAQDGTEGYFLARVTQSYELDIVQFVPYRVSENGLSRNSIALRSNGVGDAVGIGSQQLYDPTQSPAYSHLEQLVIWSSDAGETRLPIQNPVWNASNGGNPILLQDSIFGFSNQQVTSSQYFLWNNSEIGLLRTSSAGIQSVLASLNPDEVYNPYGLNAIGTRPEFDLSLNPRDPHQRDFWYAANDLGEIVLTIDGQTRFIPVGSHTINFDIESLGDGAFRHFSVSVLGDNRTMFGLAEHVDSQDIRAVMVRGEPRGVDVVFVPDFTDLLGYERRFSDFLTVRASIREELGARDNVNFYYVEPSGYQFQTLLDEALTQDLLPYTNGLTRVSYFLQSLFDLSSADETFLHFYQQFIAPRYRDFLAGSVVIEEIYTIVGNAIGRGDGVVILAHGTGNLSANAIYAFMLHEGTADQNSILIGAIGSTAPDVGGISDFSEPTLNYYVTLLEDRIVADLIEADTNMTMDLVELSEAFRNPKNLRFVNAFQVFLTIFADGLDAPPLDPNLSANVQLKDPLGHSISGAYFVEGSDSRRVIVEEVSRQIDFAAGLEN